MRHGCATSRTRRSHRSRENRRGIINRGGGALATTSTHSIPPLGERIIKLWELMIGTHGKSCS
jgi:hypothetical protein